MVFSTANEICMKFRKYSYILKYLKYSLFATSQDFILDKYDGWTEEEIQLDLDRRVKSCPQPFPNGWAVAHETRDVPNGGRKRFVAFGKDFLYFKEENTGTPRVVLLYCSMSGADLEEDGTIEGDKVYCSSCGKGRGKPCGIPKDFRDIHGLVYVWHHEDGIKVT